MTPLHPRKINQRYLSLKEATRRAARTQALLAILGAGVLSSLAWSPALATSGVAQGSALETYFNAKGGCRVNRHLYNSENMTGDRYLSQGNPDFDLFGKPILKWSDRDIATIVGMYRDCETKHHEAVINTCMNSGYDRGQCERGNKISPIVDQDARRIERDYGELVTRARNQEAQRQAQRAARIALEKSEAQAQRDRAEAEARRRVEQMREQEQRDRQEVQRLREQAEAEAIGRQEQLREQIQRDKKLAEHLRQQREREAERIAPLLREADEARRNREEADKALSETRKQLQRAEQERKNGDTQAGAAGGQQPELKRRELPAPVPTKTGLKFTPNTVTEAFNRAAAELGLSATKDKCWKLNAGGIQCNYKITEILSLNATALNEDAYSTSLSFMGGVAKDEPMSALHIMSAAFVIAELANPEQPKEYRAQTVFGMIQETTNEIKSKPTEIRANRTMGNVDYTLKFYESLGFWMFSAQIR